MSARRLVAVAVGALLGGTLRWLALSVPGPDPHLVLLVVNTSAAAGLGWLVGSVRSGRIRSTVFADLVGPGLCGALSTWSALAVELGEDLLDGRPLVAVGWVTIGVTAGVAAAWSGSRLAGTTPDGGTGQ